MLTIILGSIMGVVGVGIVGLVLVAGVCSLLEKRSMRYRAWQIKRVSRKIFRTRYDENRLGS